MTAILEGETELREGIAAVKTLVMLSLDKENKAIIKANDKRGVHKRLYNSSDEGIQEAASGVIREIEGNKKHSSKSSGMSALSFFLFKQYFDSTLTLRALSSHGERS